MAATTTKSCRVLVGGDTWAYDLNQHSHGFDSTDTLNQTDEAASDRVWVERLLTEYSRQISIPNLFYGDASKALSIRNSGFAILVLGDAGAAQGWLGGNANWLSVPREAPQSGIVAGGVDLMLRTPWGTGSKVERLNYNATVNSASFAGVVNTALAYLVITDKPDGELVVTIGDGTTDVDVSFSSNGVKAVSLLTLENSIASGTVSIPTLSSDETVTGYFLVGTTYEVPGEVLT